MCAGEISFTRSSRWSRSLRRFIRKLRANISNAIHHTGRPETRAIRQDTPVFLKDTEERLESCISITHAWGTAAQVFVELASCSRCDILACGHGLNRKKTSQCTGNSVPSRWEECLESFRGLLLFVDNDFGMNSVLTVLRVILLPSRALIRTSSVYRGGKDLGNIKLQPAWCIKIRPISPHSI